MQSFLCDCTTSCEAYSFMTDGHGIFNVCTKMGVCCTHEGGGGVRHKQICTRIDSEGQKNCVIARVLDPGSSGLISDSPTTEIRPLCYPSWVERMSQTGLLRSKRPEFPTREIPKWDSKHTTRACVTGQRFSHGNISQVGH